MASGRIIDYLGSGLAANRPATPDLFTGTVGLWFSTDTNVLSAWDGTSWTDVGGGFANPMTTLGDIITGGASGVAQRLGVGADTEVLTVVSGVPAWAAGGVGGGAMQFVGEVVVAGSAATVMTVSGLDLATDQSYYLQVSCKNASAGSSPVLSLFYNADTTASNYHRQLITGNGGTVTGARANDAVITAIAAGTSNSTLSKILISPSPGGIRRAVFDTSRDNTTALLVQKGGHYWVTDANITSITISSSVASAIDIGSFLKVFKITS